MSAPSPFVSVAALDAAVRQRRTECQQLAVCYAEAMDAATPEVAYLESLYDELSQAHKMLVQTEYERQTLLHAAQLAALEDGHDAP